MQTTIIHVTFDEELISELTISLPCKKKPGNCKKLSKTRENSKISQKNEDNSFRKIYGIPKIFLAQITYNLLYFRII